jgi:hypothetical protein
MFRRISVLALSCLCLVSVAPLRAAGAQTVRRLSAKDVPVLVNELRVRLRVPDTATVAASMPARVTDVEYKELAGAASQALADFNDQTDLKQQEACAAQWGTRDTAGASLRKEVQARRSNLELLANNAALLVPLIEKYNGA